MIASLLPWIVFLPALGAFANGVLGALFWRRNKTMAWGVACGTVFLSFVFSLLCTAELAGLPPEARMEAANVEARVATFIPVGMLEAANAQWANLEVSWTYRFDPLSSFMALVVTGIGFLIHVYSIGYMAHEEGFRRFFAYLNLFMAMMLTLVLSANFVTMFVGWEGVGLCSYLLIGFFIKELWTSDAANKAFIVNRVGDLFMVLAVGLAFLAFGSLDFAAVNERAVAALHHGADISLWGGRWILSPVTLCTMLGLLVFAASTAKSAQFPLYVWLPDAMAGPTPVSALIHAATMVTAGIYAIVRLNAVFQIGSALHVVAVVGALTAMFAATIGVAQNDIKKVLAYSTVSQLGYMFMALGAGAFVAGMFHLMTHAFFKALLFLGSGSVIHAMSGAQDMKKMGGLKKHLPVTHLTMFVGCLAIAGFPPLAGFFSKDEVLFHVFGQSKFLWAMGLLTALMTSFYMFRLYFMTFHGRERMDEHTRHHVHESPKTMTVPLLVLAAGAAVAGFLGLPHAFASHMHLVENWLSPALYEVHAHEAHHAPLALELTLMALSVAMAAAGFLWARRWYASGGFEAPAALASRFAWAQRLVRNKYFIDEAYTAIFVDGGKWLMRRFWDFDRWIIDGFFVNGLGGLLSKIVAYFAHFFDKFFVDGLVNLQAWMTKSGGGLARRVQTGFVQNYLLIFSLGVALLVFFFRTLSALGS
jgi:NADH-quinone oxidoreductase subunit L